MDGLSTEIRTLILKNSRPSRRDAARRAGMRGLAEDGRRSVEEGITTIEEVLSVTTVHEMEPTETKLAHPVAAANGPDGAAALVDIAGNPRTEPKETKERSAVSRGGLSTLGPFGAFCSKSEFEFGRFDCHNELACSGL